MFDDKTEVYSERRRGKRVPVPEGTKAQLKGDSGVSGSFEVRDLSIVGMLVCDHYSREYFFENSSISEIHIEITKRIKGTGPDDEKSYLFIRNGRIAHSFIDDISNRLCHGIEFLYDDKQLREKLMEAVEASPDSIN